jgi:hypothetical protein
MSVLVQGEGQQLLLTKGAPESVLGRCSSALANSEPPPTGGNAAMGTGIATSGRQVVPLTEGMRRSLLERMGQYGGAWILATGLVINDPQTRVKVAVATGPSCEEHTACAAEADPGAVAFNPLMARILDLG